MHNYITIKCVCGEEHVWYHNCDDLSTVISVKEEHIHEHAREVPEIQGNETL